MTRHDDHLTALRTLDPADPEASAGTARARADLERILLLGPVAPDTELSARPPRRRLALATAGLTAAAVATVGVLALPSVVGGDAAFASWTPAPEGLSATDSKEAAEACREAQADGPGADSADDLAAARTAVSERRGDWTTVLLVGDGGFSALCVTDGSARWFSDWIGSVGAGAAIPEPGGRDVVATDLGTGTLRAGDLSLAAGRVGSEVVSVGYDSPTEGKVTATVSEGHFAFWLPGDELEEASSDGVAVQVGYRDGSTRTLTLLLGAVAREDAR